MPVLIRLMWQFKTAVFLHWCLIWLFYWLRLWPRIWLLTRSSFSYLCRNLIVSYERVLPAYHRFRHIRQLLFGPGLAPDLHRQPRPHQEPRHDVGLHSAQLREQRRHRLAQPLQSHRQRQPGCKFLFHFKFHLHWRSLPRCRWAKTQATVSSYTIHICAALTFAPCTAQQQRAVFLYI